MATLDPDAPIISYSSLSKAYLAPGWRAGWMAVGATPRLDGALAAIKKLADGRLCSPGPMQYGVVAALTGDRSHQVEFRHAAAGARATLTTERLNAIEGMRCVAPRGAFYAMPQVTLPPGRTDADYVLGAAARAPGFSCVYGSGFGTAPADGFFRIVFLASPAELSAIYDDIAAFTRDYLAADAAVRSTRAGASRRRPSAADRLRHRRRGRRAAAAVGALLIRSTLVTVYISALFAMGISPLVRMIERQTRDSRSARAIAALARHPASSTRRSSAPSSAIGMIVIPPLVDQAEELWRTLPEKIEQAQRVPDPPRHPARADHARRSGAAGARRGGRRHGRRDDLRLRPKRGRRRLRLVTILLLTFYMLVESREIFSFFVRLFPRHAARARRRQSAPR